MTNETFFASASRAIAAAVSSSVVDATGFRELVFEVRVTALGGTGTLDIALHDSASGDDNTWAELHPLPTITATGNYVARLSVPFRKKLSAIYTIAGCTFMFQAGVTLKTREAVA
jgi:hypothetical protein